MVLNPLVYIGDAYLAEKISIFFGRLLLQHSFNGFPGHAYPVIGDGDF